MLNLDTHIVLFAISNNLTPREREILSADKWSISSICFWEISKLAQLGRIKLDIKSDEFQKFLAMVHIWPLSVEICHCICHLDFRSDPADELIASTSIVENVPLVTRDAKILRSKMVPFAQ